MFSIIRLFILIIIAAALAVFVYYLIYTSSINKKILSGEVTGKKMVDIPKVVMIAVIAVLVLLCVVLARAVREEGMRTEVVMRNNYAVIDVSDPDDLRYVSYWGTAELNDASYAGMYSTEENPGYSKEVVEDGDFTFTSFRRTSAADSFHPDFLCFVEYTGDAQNGTEMYSYSKAAFNSLTGDDHYAGGSGGGVPESRLLYIGYLDEGYEFVLEIDLLDEQAEEAYMDAMDTAFEADRGEFPVPKDFAQSSSTIRICFE